MSREAFTSTESTSYCSCITTKHHSSNSQTHRYCPKSQSPYPCPPGQHSVLIENVVFEDIQGSVNDPSGLVGQFNCSSLNPCRNISLRDIDLTSTSTERAPSFQCAYMSGPDTDVNLCPKRCVRLKFFILQC